MCVFTVTRLDQPARRRAAAAGARRHGPRGWGCSTSPGSPGIQARQVTGRTHRDGHVSPWRIAYAEDTVEEQVGRVMVERLAVASTPRAGTPARSRDRRAARTPTGCRAPRSPTVTTEPALSPEEPMPARQAPCDRRQHGDQLVERDRRRARRTAPPRGGRSSPRSGPWSPVRHR